MIFRIMRNFALCLPLCGLSLPLAVPALAQAAQGAETVKPAENRHRVEVQSAWARAMLPAAKVGAGYFEIKNNGNTALRLASVQSDIARKVEIHSMFMEGNIMKMRPLGDGVEIPPHSGLSFKPGSYHLMFIEPKAPFKAGETFKTRFKFADGEEMDVIFTVRAAMQGSRKESGKMRGHAAAH